MKWVARILDLLVVLFLGLWLSGALHHGADPRRAAIVTLTLLLVRRDLSGRSICARLARSVWTALQRPRIRWCGLLLFFVGASILGCLQTASLHYALFDVGIFHQILWSLAHGHGFHSTVSGAGNFLLDHFAPSLTLLTPFYWLSGSSPYALAVIHAGLIAIGIAAWIFTAERIPGADARRRGELAAGTLVFALCFDSLWGNLRWGFHENSIAFATLSWALALWVTGKSRSTLGLLSVSLLLWITAGSKEILLPAMAIAFTVRIFRSRRAWPLAVGSAGLMLALFVLFERMPHPPDKNYFIRYYAYFGNGLGAFMRGLILSPWKSVEAVGGMEMLRYLKTVFLPWLGLPLYAVALGLRRHPRAEWPALLIIIVPSFLSAILATYPPLREPGYHYVLELWPVLAPLTLLALAELPGALYLWIFLAAFTLDQDPLNQAREYGSQAWAEGAAAVRESLRAIPEQASVASDELGGTWVSGRREVLRFHGDEGLADSPCADYFVLETGHEIPAACATSRLIRIQR